jgi:thiaminase/transcriptional activator TenA
MKLVLLLVCIVSWPTQAQTFTERAWKQAAPLYREIVRHPFNQELASGKLPTEKFEYYSEQDALYLADFAKALTLLAAKLENKDQIQTVLELARGALSESSVATKGIKNQAAVFYTSFLLSEAAFHSAPQIAAALLPCYEIYLELARELIVSSPETNRYLPWLRTYSSPGYAATVEKMRKLTNALADSASPAVTAKMLETYLQATRLEAYFWDAAYAQGVWPPASP